VRLVVDAAPTRVDAFLCPFGDVVYIQVLGWGEHEGSTFAQVACSGLNLHRSYILLASLAEVTEPQELAARVQYTAMAPFWITGKVGVLLSTSDIVYEWPPSGWRVPWWPTNLGVEANEEADAGQLQRVNSLLAELDSKIQQEERAVRETHEVQRVRRISSGSAEPRPYQLSPVPASSGSGADDGGGATADMDGEAQGSRGAGGGAGGGAGAGGGGQALQMLPHNFRAGSYRLNDRGHLVKVDPAPSSPLQSAPVALDDRTAAHAHRIIASATESQGARERRPLAPSSGDLGAGMRKAPCMTPNA
jgi:hypothetical protein